MDKKKAKKKAKKKKTTKKKAANSKSKKKVAKVPRSHNQTWQDETGMFRAGNPGGPGRPFKRNERFLQAITDNVSERDWKAIIREAVKLAKLGDDKARTWLSKWLIGEPKVEDETDQKKTIIDMLKDPKFLAWEKSEERRVIDG